MFILCFLFVLPALAFSHQKNIRTLRQRCGYIEFPIGDNDFDDQVSFIIINPDKQRLSLIFFEFNGFDDNCSTESICQCSNNYIQISTNNSPLLGEKYCSPNKKPGVIISDGGPISIVTHVLGVISTNSSFRATFTDNSGNVCGKENITTDIQCIHSRNYPLDYGINENCTLFINNPEKFNLTLAFRDIYIEQYRLSNKCDSDILQVFETTCNSSSQLLGTYCGNKIPDNLMSNSKTLCIQFTSDKHLEERGFFIELISKKEEFAEITTVVLNGTENVVTESGVKIKIIVIVVAVLASACLVLFAIYWVYIRRSSSKTDEPATTEVSELNDLTVSPNTHQRSDGSRVENSNNDIQLLNVENEYDVTNHKLLVRKSSNKVLYDHCIDGIYDYSGAEHPQLGWNYDHVVRTENID